MAKAHFIQALHDRYYPKTCSGHKPCSTLTAQPESLSPEDRRRLAEDLLSKGERELLDGKMNALELFDQASLLDANNPDLWFRQGLALFEHGTANAREKTLFLACKNFKIAAKLSEHNTDHAGDE